MVGLASLQAAGDAEKKDLDAALKKIREGHTDEALALIREQAARHPEWPPSPLVLARLLFSAGQNTRQTPRPGAGGRRGAQAPRGLSPVRRT